MVPETFKESSDPIADFTSSLIEISKECIPQTSTNPTKSTPWYNDDCKEAIKQRKQAVPKSKDLQIPTIAMTSEYLELKPVKLEDLTVLKRSPDPRYSIHEIRKHTPLWI